MQRPAVSPPPHLGHVEHPNRAGTLHRRRALEELVVGQHHLHRVPASCRGLGQARDHIRQATHLSSGGEGGLGRLFVCTASEWMPLTPIWSQGPSMASPQLPATFATGAISAAMWMMVKGLADSGGFFFLPAPPRWGLGRVRAARSQNLSSWPFGQATAASSSATLGRATPAWGRAVGNEVVFAASGMPLVDRLPPQPHCATSGPAGRSGFTWPSRRLRGLWAGSWGGRPSTLQTLSTGRQDPSPGQLHTQSTVLSTQLLHQRHQFGLRRVLHGLRHGE